MTLKYALTAAIVLGFAGTAIAADAASFVIIKDANKHCRILEKKVVSEDQLGMQVGKQSYPTREEANIDVKVICDTP
jgi:hypothetical protein